MKAKDNGNLLAGAETIEAINQGRFEDDARINRPDIGRRARFVDAVFYTADGPKCDLCRRVLPSRRLERHIACANFSVDDFKEMRCNERMMVLG